MRAVLVHRWALHLALRCGLISTSFKTTKPAANASFTSVHVYKADQKTTASVSESAGIQHRTLSSTMNLKSFAILGALCAAVAAQDTENKFEVNTLFYRQQCGAQKLIANPRLCFKTALDINKEAIQGKGQYDGYSTSDGHGKCSARLFLHRITDALVTRIIMNRFLSHVLPRLSEDVHEGVLDLCDPASWSKVLRLLGPSQF